MLSAVGVDMESVGAVVDGDFGFFEGAGEAEDAGVKKSSSEEIAPESSLSRFRGDEAVDIDVCWLMC
jgi:formylmethanofuran dehydrogenase subunit C